MRVGFEASNFYFGLSNGTPVYMRHLLDALLDADPTLEIVLLYQHRVTPAAAPILAHFAAHPRVTIRWGGLRSTGIPRGGFWAPWHHTVARVVGPVDVYHANDFVWPRPAGIPCVTTIHDLTTRTAPETHQAANRWRDTRKLAWAVRSATRVIAISHATARDFVQLAGGDPARVTVVLEARDPDKVLPTVGAAAGIAAMRTTYGLADAPYILSVGTYEPRKNQVRLLDAFAELATTHPTLRLVLAGAAGWRDRAVRTTLERVAQRTGRVHTLGFVPSADLAALYADALVFAYPSLYEGFGLPLLEAMGAGAPVLTSNVSSMPEVAGDAACLVDPTSVPAIAAGLRSLVDDPARRAELRARGIAREAQFSWAATAEGTLAVYRAAIAEGARA